MSPSADIVVVAAHGNGRVHPETYELITVARRLKAHQSGEIRIMVMGDKTGPLAETLSRSTGEAVAATDCPALSQYSGEACRRLLVQALKQRPAAYILALNNSQGLDFAPAAAAELGAACITGVTDLAKTDAGLCFQKHVYGGKLKASLKPRADICVMTIQPGAFKRDEQTPAEAGPVSHQSCSAVLEKTKPLGTRPAAGDTSAITEAKVIVAAGNGVGEEENMALIHQLAALFQKSAVAGTRTVCDQGWLDYSQQVGVTGATVSPELYIACGISGALQHVMGMQGAGWVIAINRDGRAAIFNEADICIVADLTRFIPLLLETWENKQTDSKE